MPTRDSRRPCNLRATPSSSVGSRCASDISCDQPCAVSCFCASVYLTLRKRGADARGDCTFNSGRPNCSWSDRKPLPMLAANCCASVDIGLRWSNSLNTACTRRVISWPYRLSLVRWAALGEGPEGRGACGHDRLAGSREVSVMWERRPTRRYSRLRAASTVSCGMSVSQAARCC